MSVALANQSLKPARPAGSPLESFPFLRALPDRVRDAVLDRSVIRSIRRATPVFWQGDGLSTLPVVVSGYVKLLRHTEGGREVMVEIAGPGSPLCWSSALNGSPAPLSAIALDGCKVARLPITPIRHCISVEPRAALRYARLMADQYETLTTQVSETRAPSVSSRLGGLLLFLLKRWGDPSTGEVPIHLTRRELADAAGTTEETATRVMRKWDRAALVETLKTGFLIRDPIRLQDVVDGQEI